jgi:hypothetical protein
MESFTCTVEFLSGFAPRKLFNHNIRGPWAFIGKPGCKGSGRILLYKDRSLRMNRGLTLTVQVYTVKLDIVHENMTSEKNFVNPLNFAFQVIMSNICP